MLWFKPKYWHLNWIKFNLKTKSQKKQKTTSGLKQQAMPVICAHVISFLAASSQTFPCRPLLESSWCLVLTRNQTLSGCNTPCGNAPGALYLYTRMPDHFPQANPVRVWKFHYSWIRIHTWMLVQVTLLTRISLRWKVYHGMFRGWFQEGKWVQVQ